MSDPFDRLDALLMHVWHRLSRGAADADDAFRLVVLATAGAQGPEARMVALRRADRASGEVEVHSDLRTAKVRALSDDPRASILAWDPTARLQVRLTLSVEVAAGDASRWDEVPPEARANYGTDPAPGTPVATPEDMARTPSLDRFAVLIGTVGSVDVVSLAHDPHRRAVFDGAGGRWVAP